MDQHIRNPTINFVSTAVPHIASCPGLCNSLRRFHDMRALLTSLSFTARRHGALHAQKKGHRRFFEWNGRLHRPSKAKFDCNRMPRGALRRLLLWSSCRGSPLFAEPHNNILNRKNKSK